MTLAAHQAPITTVIVERADMGTPPGGTTGAGTGTGVGRRLRGTGRRAVTLAAECRDEPGTVVLTVPDKYPKGVDFTLTRADGSEPDR